MMKIFLFLSIPIAVGIVLFIRTKMQDKQKPYILGALWTFILIFAFLLFSSINDEIRFDELKNERYQVVIKN